MVGPKAAEQTIPDFEYSNMSLLVHSLEVPAELRRLEQILVEQEIKDVVRTDLGRQRQQYAFLCLREQFHEIFHQLQQQPGNSLDLIISDPVGGCEIMLVGPSEEQAMALAGEPNATLQMADALRLIPAEKIVALGSHLLKHGHQNGRHADQEDDSDEAEAGQEAAIQDASRIGNQVGEKIQGDEDS